VERRGLERAHAGKWYELCADRTILGGTILKLQLLQEGPSLHLRPFLLGLLSAWLTWSVTQFAETTPGADLSPFRRLICGGCAGITSVTFTYPLDIVRTRLSVQSASFSSLSELQRKNLPGMWQTFITMYRTEGGFPALYRGILPTVAGVAPYVSSTRKSPSFRFPNVIRSG